jgi:hypothetical protein
MWGICKRAKAFFTHFKAEYIFEGPFCKEDQTGFLGSLTNKFGALGGFQKIIAFTQR